ncbi:phosphate regulon sensor protein PhoR [Clostridium tepidiprofundi DSM 19306]|uniref:histidine kinase n=1 Tax=Clostridium tepidiprofundi DSM 19306 TaxID=1121338 RepID=A0A151B426_9CLOT|nr:HAMP domain-containing sensor histidine kinase [Clostridium tepidiprofundi]KYH34550.1 phosphate regulon sensor protein PhoR [Clostridium tepidiprofundi DSM 19306]
MDGVISILRRFICVTILICILLFIFNFVIFGSFVFRGMYEEQPPKNILKNVVSQLERKDATYILGESSQNLLAQNHAWAMLIDNTGKVIWNYKLPKEIPLSYKLKDIAKFSRNYLMDYPVFVWEYDDGLVVIGYPKKSYAKYQFYFPINWISSLPIRTITLFVSNIILALFLSVLIGTKLVKSVKPLIDGVHALSKEKPICLEVKGIFSDLAKSINYTSNILQEKNNALKARDEARSNWIAGISHDIRTPLSIVLGYANELEENIAVPAEQRQQAGIIRKQAQKLRSLVSDLNLVSMLEYEMQPLNLKIIRLAMIARQVASEFLNNGLDEKFTIALDISDEDIKVKVDKKLLIRAINNLVQNSIMHNPNGCKILLKACFSPNNMTCQFIVADNGKGVPHDELSKLTELPYSSSRKHSVCNGHGLGLPMVARICQAHHGQLVLESEIGKGMKAIINLPLT